MLENKSKMDVLGKDSKLLYISRYDIVISFTKIFGISVTTGVVPDECKTARLTHVYNGKGSTGNNDCGNYRPISVIPFIEKILEKCIQHQFLCYLYLNTVL